MSAAAARLAAAMIGVLVAVTLFQQVQITRLQQKIEGVQAVLHVAVPLQREAR